MESIKPFESSAKTSESLDAKVFEARRAFEALAKRLDVLLEKGELTPAEQKEVDLIYNNALVLEELIQGKTPKEFTR